MSMEKYEYEYELVVYYCIYTNRLLLRQSVWRLTRRTWWILGVRLFSQLPVEDFYVYFPLLLTVYFGTPSMFITLWFGFDYGTNPPLGTLIIWQVHLCAWIWKCCVYVGKHGHKGRIRNKLKGAFTESCSCSWAWWSHFQWWQGPKCYEGTPPRIEA
jgi:hypothetical protein